MIVASKLSAERRSYTGRVKVLIKMVLHSESKPQHEF